MFFLPLANIWLASEPALQQVIPSTSEVTSPLENDDFSIDEVIEIKPFFLEGSVDEFDAVRRAVDLARKLPRSLCGTYRSFDDKSSKKATVTFTAVKPIGHMIKLKGLMSINKSESSFTGILNAKSDQMELIPLNNYSSLDLDPGGTFIGLQGAKLLAWKSSRLDNPGGRMELKTCEAEQLSKSFNVSPIWRLN